MASSSQPARLGPNVAAAVQQFSQPAVRHDSEQEEVQVLTDQLAGLGVQEPGQRDQGPGQAGLDQGPDQQAGLAVQEPGQQAGLGVQGTGQHAGLGDQGPGQHQQVPVREVAEGEQVMIEQLLDPDVPGPHPGPVTDDVDGFSQIDKWGVWQCALCEFPILQNIPSGYRQTWATAVDRILVAIQESEGGLLLERALKWFLILPKALWRQGRRGGKAGKGLVAQRVNCLVRGDWGGLLTLLDKDCKMAEREDRRGRPRDTGTGRREEVEVQRKRNKALLLLSKGLVGKAVRTITSNGIGDMSDPQIRDQMAAKYPERVHQLPTTVTKRQCVDNLHGLKEILLGLEGGVSPGTGGMRPEYLICLAEAWGSEPMRRLEELGMRYLTGDLPMWWYKVWSTVATVPLFKTVAQTTVRPVGIMPCLERQFRKMVTRANKPVMVNYFEPQQVVFSEAGAAKLVHSMRMLVESNPHFVLVKCDIKNAFNSISRARILQVMDEDDSLQHLVWHAALSLAPAGPLESNGKVWGEAADGATQGDPEAGGYFSVGWHPQLRELDRIVSVVGGAARAGCDDLCVAGPPEVVFPAVEQFWADIEATCCLHLERSKTEVFTWSGVLPPNTPEGLARAGSMIDQEFLPGFIIYGIPVGDRRYVKHHLALKVQAVAREVGQVLKVLQGEGQAIWTVARASTLMKLDYHLALCYPSDIVEAAKEMDKLLKNMVECATGMSIPLLDEGRGVECCPQTTVTRLQGRSYQEFMLRLPVRQGGMGLRSMEDVSMAAFVGGVEQSLPHFTGEDGVCQQLTTVLGEMQDVSYRWRDMLASGCRTGGEFETAWNVLRQEAVQASQYLDRDMGGPLEVEVDGAGDGRVDGSTRRLVTTWLEDTRTAVLKKALENHPDQTARAVWVNPQLDKLSQGWLLAMPGPEGFSHAEFGETVARLLCLPSPCCQPKVGVALGQRGLRIDDFGDNLMSVSNIPGDSFRIRHDKVKTVLNGFCLANNIRAECEVFGLFRDLIPTVALDEDANLQRGQGRQGLLPDFRLEFPSPLGQPEHRLAELKIIGAVKTWYPRKGNCARRKKGVERRKDELQEEYRKPLAALDRMYHGTQGGEVGPLVRRLQGYGQLQGLVVGAFQEASKDLHALLDTLADSKLRAMGLARGREGTEQERAIILAGLRRKLSMAAAKANSACLLDRVSRVGEEHRQAAKRRAWAKSEEERLQEERRAYWHAYVRGRVRGEFTVA